MIQTTGKWKLTRKGANKKNANKKAIETSFNKWKVSEQNVVLLVLICTEIGNYTKQIK